MYTPRALWPMLVAVALTVAVGCRREETPVPPPSAPPQPQAQQTPAPAPQAPVAVTPAPPAPVIPTTGPAAEAAVGAAQMSATEASAMLDQAVKYINENKYDLADKALSQVEAHKASLPQSLQGQITGARKMLEARTMMNQAQPKLPATLPTFSMPNK